MKTLIFSFIILMCSVCYGQLPTTSDDIYVLVVDRREAKLSREVEGYFRSSTVTNFITSQRYQFAQYYGQDLSKSWHDKWQITHYPTVVHLQKTDGGYGLKESKIILTFDDIRQVLGAKPKTYAEAPRSVPVPQRQYAAPPQQYVQQSCPPGGT